MSTENQNSATDFTRLFHNYKRDEDFIQHAFSTSATSHIIVWDRTKQLKNGQPFGLQFQNTFLALPTFPVRTNSCSNSLFFSLSELFAFSSTFTFFGFIRFHSQGEMVFLGKAEKRCSYIWKNKQNYSCRLWDEIVIGI